MSAGAVIQRSEIRACHLLGRSVPKGFDLISGESFGCTVYLVVLAPTLSIVQQRKPNAYKRWAYLQEDMTRDIRAIGLWVDTGDLTSEQTVEFILANKVGAELQ